MIVGIDRYIARLMFWPLIATLVVSAMLLLLIRMAELFSLVLDQGGTASTAFLILANLVPQYLSYGIPIGLLFGVLRAFRNLSLRGELDAISGMGVSTMRLLRVPMVYAAGLAFVMLALVSTVQPRSIYKFERLLFDVRNGLFGYAVPVGEFARLSDKIVLRAGRSRQGGKNLSDVFLNVADDEGRLLTVFAAQAALSPQDEAGLSSITFKRGTVTRTDFADGRARSVAFDVYDLPFKLPNLPIFRARGANEREMTLTEQFAVVRSSESDPLARDQALSGIYRRLAQTFVLFLLPPLGIAFARPSRRSESELGLVLALALFIIYNEFSLYGERLGFNGQAAPLPVQLGPLLAFSAIALGLFVPAATRAGEPPLSVLARFEWRRFFRSLQFGGKAS